MALENGMSPSTPLNMCEIMYVLALPDCLIYRVSKQICYNSGNSTLLVRRLVLFFPGV